MFKLYFKVKKYLKEKGFTLVELLAVIVILAIIMLITIPVVLNSVLIAKRKTFITYIDRSVNQSHQMYEKGILDGEPYSECIIYNVKTDLDLHNTGEFNGWILLNTSTNDVYITLYNNDFALVAYHYSNPNLKMEDYIKNKSTVDADTISQEYLCNNSNCDTCKYASSDGDVVIDNDDYKLKNGAILMMGNLFNEKVHELYGKPYSTMEINEITSIEKSDVLNESAKKIDVSDESSNNKVYIWRDGDKLYFYSDAKGDIFLNPISYMMFAYMPNLTYIDFGNLNTSKVEIMSFMFQNANLQNTDLNLIDTRNVTNMYSVFRGVKASKIDISKWNTNKVNDMSGLFEGCANLTDINFGNINTSNVTSMSFMFSGCKVITKLDLSIFNTSKVQNMEGMFEGCLKLTDLNIKSFDTHNVTNMSYMFAVCESFTTIDLSNFNTSKVTNMSSMFNGNYGSSFRDYSQVHYNHFKNIIGLEDFDVRNVKSMSQMFYYDAGLETINLNKWNPASLTNADSMFQRSGLRSIEITSFNSPNLRSIIQMFMQCYSLQTVNLSGMNVSKVTTMSGVFMYDSSLTEVNLSGWKTDSAEDMNSMFMYCNNLSKVDLSNFNTNNVTNISGFFENCYYLEEIDLSSFSFAKQVSVGGMFKKCTSLKRIYVSPKWSNSNFIETWDKMFEGSTKLLNYDPNNTGASKAYVGDGGYLSYR